MSDTRALRSPYMEWAKLHSSAPYNLAASGMMNCPITELPVRLEDLQINGDNFYGYAPLLERLARLKDVPTECVVTTAGTSMANHLSLAAVLAPGDQVLMEHPTYELLLSAARYLGAEIIRFPRREEDGWRVDPELIRRALTPKTKLVVITNLHNPTSILTEDPCLREIGKLAHGVGAQVLVDEVYLEAAFTLPRRSAFHLGPNFIVTSSLTKAYGLSGLRCGWILAQPELARRIWRINDLYAATAAHPAELLSVIALDHLPQIESRARAILAANHRRFQEFIGSRRDIQCVVPVHGTTAFPRLLRGSVDGFCKLLREKYETSVVPGRFFEMPQHFRLGLCGDPPMTSAAFDRMASALDEFARS